MGITRFILRRLAVGLLTLVVVSVVVFVLTQALGDPATAILGRDAQNAELLHAKRVELGLDRSLLAQYVDWLQHLIRGDAGTSYATGEPIVELAAPRLRNSVFLMLCAAAVALPVSLIVATRSALRQDGRFDSTANFAVLSLAAVPEFAIGAVLVALFSTSVLTLLPAVSSVRGDSQPWDDLDGMVLPTATLALVAIPYLVRSLRASLVDELASGYVDTARSVGVTPRRVLWRHALPNALPPTLQVLALSVSYLIGGVVVVERVFNYPGIGSALVEAIAAHNVPVVQFIAMTLSALYVICGIAADVGAVLLTPRLRTALR